MAKEHSKPDQLAEEASFRLSAAQKRRLLLAARKEGVKPSRLMRDAVMRHCDRIIGQERDPLAELAGIIGAVEAGGGEARRTGTAFTDIAAEKHGRRRRTGR